MLSPSLSSLYLFYLPYRICSHHHVFLYLTWVLYSALYAIRPWKPGASKLQAFSSVFSQLRSGRRTLFRLTHKRPPTPTLTANSRQAAIRNAIAAFWKLLAHFAATPQPSNLWSSLAEDHPFLH